MSWFRKNKEDIQFHDDMDIAFKPLKDFLSSHCDEQTTLNTLDQYMYMMHDEEKTYNKHFGDRSYFNVFNDGETEGGLQDWRDWND